MYIAYCQKLYIQHCHFLYILSLLITMGLWLNLLARIFKFLSTKHKLFFIISSSIILAYSIILILFYRNVNVTSYSSLLNNGHYIILLIIGITLTIPGYFHVVKQELYQVYSEKNLGNGAIRNLKTSLTSSNVFIRILILEYIRCKIFKKFLIQMSSYAIAGAVFILVFNLKVIGLGMFLGIYTYNMLQFTIYFSSNYFDGLQTKPISIKTLLLSSYYIHIIITAVLFLILLIFVSIYDKSYILSLITLYLYTSGPIALLLLTNVLFAEKFDLFPLQLNTPIQRTLAQKVIGVISAVTLIGGASIIHFFTTIGCYIILLISIVTIITHSYWIDYLHKKFIQRKYRIMDNLRKN